MSLTLHRSEGLNQVRAVSADGVDINGTLYTGSLIISANQLIDGWPPVTVDQLNEEQFAPVLELKPDLLLLGTGHRQVFLRPQLYWFLLSAGIGVEVMTTAAACRTFNVVMSEGRNAVAALLPVAPTENSA
jgi:uncharacterized protein